MRKAAIGLAVVLALVVGCGGLTQAQDDVETTGAADCCAACSAYGSADDGRLNVIRQFRDEYLMANPAGRAAADLYYEISPPVARFIDDHPAVKPLARAAWTPVVAISTLAVDATLPERAAIGAGITLTLGLAILMVRRRVRRLLQHSRRH
jgi:hypothetical protein